MSAEPIQSLEVTDGRTPVDFPRARQMDLFIAPLSAPSLRDQRETMERPFFSLAKRRLTPIEYRSPKGDVTVKVSPNVTHGMATIWDFDILIWAATQINDQVERKRRDKTAADPSATLFFHPADLLRSIGRGVGGKDREELRAALARLSSTYVQTNIRQHHQSRRREKGFTWLAGWDEETDTRTGQSKGMSIILCEWLFMGCLNQSLLLQIAEEYFHLTGGFERWLYRIARKHSHGQQGGFTFDVRTLHEKSGSDQPFRKFKYELKRVVDKGPIIDYGLDWIDREGEDPQLRIYPLEGSARVQVLASVHAGKQRRRKADDALKAAPHRWSELLDPRQVHYLRTMFPSEDLTDLFSRFITWNEAKGSRPRDMVKAFTAFVRTHQERNSDAGHDRRRREMAD